MNHSTPDRDRIKQILKEYYGSQAEIARRLRVSPVTISRWLSGHIVSAKLDALVPPLAHEIRLRTVHPDSVAAWKNKRSK
jgi:predicted XRE-type DNA-binding protein